MARTHFLTPDLIVRKALEVGDRGGPEAMTMRSIAAELGCDPMALYRHFANRETLLDAVADRAVSEVEEQDLQMPWDERILVTFHAIREAAIQHPGITSHMAARPPMGVNGRRIAEAILQALGEAELTPADTVRTFQALIAYLASALAMAVQAGTRDRRWEQVRDMMGELPEAGSSAEELFVVGSREQFQFGLKLLIAGIKSQATAGH